MNLRRKTGYGWSARCWRTGADHRLVLYALRANIDLFYTPAKFYGKRERSSCRRQIASARRRDVVMPGSVRRDRTR
ncbi:hypothetical protein KCP78_10560 [Salmonella enterica subsp. enterica]|nr:hypothetical protein KCP78_10560 [Salmonella enterica subsp. enterica]